MGRRRPPLEKLWLGDGAGKESGRLYLSADSGTPRPARLRHEQVCEGAAASRLRRASPSLRDEILVLGLLAIATILMLALFAGVRMFCLRIKNYGYLDVVWSL